MKKVKIFSIITFVIILFTLSNVTFAYDAYCPETEDGRHDFTFTSNKAVAHPHDGYRECFCGKKVYYSSSYYDECEKCRRQLCKYGLHYYLNEIHYTDSTGYNGYGKCYCGDKKYFTYENGFFHSEPYPGIVEFFNGDLYALKHPHYEYNESTGRLYKEELDGDYGVIHLGGCGVCDMLDDYYYSVEEFEIDTIIYGMDPKDYFCIDSDYEDEEPYYYDDSSYNQSYYEDDYYNYYDDDEDEYSFAYKDEDEEFYDWLSIVNDIFGSD